MSMSTSYFIRILMTSVCPFWEAACSAVCPAKTPLTCNKQNVYINLLNLLLKISQVVLYKNHNKLYHLTYISFGPLQNLLTFRSVAVRGRLD